MPRTLHALTLNDYQEFVNHYHAESDRAAVALAGSFLEHYLGSYIRAFMIPGNEADQVILRTLGSFDARIHVAHAFGLISDAERSDCLVIKEIRNEFSHSPKPIDFKNANIQNAATKLSYWKLLQDATEPNVERSPRFAYLLTIGMFVVSASRRRAQQSNRP